MTKVDFHILPAFQEHERIKYVTRLIRKAQSQSLNVLISTEDEAHQRAVSEGLWASSPDSFLAHEHIEEDFHPIQISCSDACGQHHQVLINLCNQTPNYFSRFERVFEVVSQEPSVLNASRSRYKFYKDRGYALTRHDLRDRV
ncbi:DNA polymerase III subunit chi [Reinekea marina]|uniref:DNA polymerase III subunit chi n=1 Tax=Reinekea marina TaxID=1310421 RepID=A0ABV7WQX1_9GAMM|nr:DNA polymerase III subunit chi [Reinekea marina]MDN3649931.1 DNA polymerase III subunit chi [Reinekea marina]